MANITPVWKLKKKQIEWLGTHRCKHSHTYLEHYNCYLEEHPEYQQKVGYFDIEASNLKASFGIMLSWCIYDPDADKIDFSVITAKDLKGNLDKRLVKELIEVMYGYDKLYTYFGTRFDLPFVRTRAVVHELEFPPFGSVFHKDLYYQVRNKFCLHSNRLATACEILLGETQKTKIYPEVWNKALMGDQIALDYILDHCMRDVLELHRLHKVIEKYAKDTDTSI